MITAREFLEKMDIEGSPKRCNAMIEFAKLHVEAALKEAFENAETDYTYEGESGEFEDIPIYNYFVKKDSILNSYPESNIK